SDYPPRAIRKPEAMQKQLVGIKGSSLRLVRELLKRVAYLKDRSISDEYRSNISCLIETVKKDSKDIYMSSSRIRRIMAQKRTEAKWPRNSLLVLVVKNELCNLKDSDIVKKDRKLWIRVIKSKTDQLRWDKFIPIKRLAGEMYP
ncbi:4335_t:CDS:2, partial [Dentiscutata erythropus]